MGIAWIVPENKQTALKANSLSLSLSLSLPLGHYQHQLLTNPKDLNADALTTELHSPSPTPDVITGLRPDMLKNIEAHIERAQFIRLMALSNGKRDQKKQYGSFSNVSRPVPDY